MLLRIWNALRHDRRAVEEAKSREEFLVKLGEIDFDEFTTFKNTEK